MQSEACVLKHDWHLFDIEKQLNILRYINPVNAGREKAKFLRAYAAGKYYEPFFEYEKPGPEVRAFCRKMLWIRGKLEKCRASSFAPYYIEKIDRLRKLAELLGRRDSPAFGPELVAQFGEPSGKVVRKAGRNLRTLQYADEFENLGSAAVRKILENELQAYGLEWEVRPLLEGGAKLAVNSTRGEVYVDLSARFSENSIKRYLYHEIRTHVFRAENGKRQPLTIFLSGFPGYSETEEGLAVYNEYANGLLDSETLRKYSARVIAASMAPQASFSEIFEEMLRYFPPDKAYTITHRVKRGMIDSSLPGGYTKDYVYLSGFLKVSDFLQTQPSKAAALKTLYCGKISLENFEMAQNLLERGVLKMPHYLPEMELPAQNAML